MEEQSELDRAFELAAKDPASRPEFYRLLLASDIFVIGDSGAPGEGAVSIPAGANISVLRWAKSDGTPIIPFFTSLNDLRKSLTEEVNYLRLPARIFFEMSRGSHLVLNPKSNCGKEFYPHEVEALLETGVNHIAQERTVTEPTQVLLAQPAQYPSEMVSALTSLLAKHVNITAAFLCLMHGREMSESPSLVVGFSGEGDLSLAMKEAGSVAADTAPAGIAVDFVVVEAGGSGIGQYMLRSTKPFYERSWGKKLRALFTRNSKLNLKH
ncbi:MAG: enhanced serine sensitivity protein SseB C-terminal domain-containing protein [Spongiibacteraceae bacterium]